MTTYLVVRPLREDRYYESGETLVNPEFNAQLLMTRGYLVIVPNDYSSPASKAEQKIEPTIDRLPTVEEGLEAGYSREAAEHLAQGVFGSEEDEETSIIDSVLSEASAKEDDGSTTAS